MQKREQQGTKQNRKARKEKKQKTSHHHHNHNHNHNHNNNNNNKNVRFNPLRQVSLPKKGPVTPVIYP